MHVALGMVVNGCRVDAGPVPHGESRRWALTCTVCGYWFSAKETMVATIGCDACALSVQRLDEQNFAHVRAARSVLSKRAHAAVKTALREGVLTRPAECSRCGEAHVVGGHHESYARPLDVIWLCNECHGERHGELSAAGIDTYAGTAGACVATPRPVTVPAGYRSQAAWMAERWLRERSAA